jgi:hypothetical protein
VETLKKERERKKREKKDWNVKLFKASVVDAVRACVRSLLLSFPGYPIIFLSVNE